MEWSGRITICDRCLAECRRSFIKEKEMDGGFTVLKNFEPMPEDWHYNADIGWLCPDCWNEYEELIKEFMDAGNKEEENETD